MSARIKIAISLFALSVTSAGLAEEKPYPFDVPTMQEEAHSAGIKHTYSGPWEYFVGGGAASFDCNGDRMPDLFLAGGQSEAQFYINRSKQGGALKFEKSDLGLKRQDLRRITGAYPINLNNDGHTDLVVLRVGSNMLLKGKGNCQFEKASRAFAFDGGGNGQRASLPFGKRMPPIQPWPSVIMLTAPHRGLPGGRVRTTFFTVQMAATDYLTVRRCPSVRVLFFVHRFYRLE